MPRRRRKGNAGGGGGNAMGGGGGGEPPRKWGEGPGERQGCRGGGGKGNAGGGSGNVMGGGGGAGRGGGFNANNANYRGGGEPPRKWGAGPGPKEPLSTSII